MSTSWSRERHSADTALRVLLDVLNDEDADDSRLMHAYLDAKRQLAKAFRVFAAERIDDDDALGPLKSRLEAALTALYPELPLKYRTVRGFGKTHRLLYAYLSRRVGEEVSIDELRILTGDAVHTERRLRELRDLGLEISMLEASGVRVCRLEPAMHVQQAAQTWIRREIDQDASLGSEEAALLVAMLKHSDGVIAGSEN